MKKVKFKVSNRMEQPCDTAELVMIVKAETREAAIIAGAEFGKKHGLLLSYE